MQAGSSRNSSAWYSIMYIVSEERRQNARLHPYSRINPNGRPISNLDEHYRRRPGDDAPHVFVKDGFKSCAPPPLDDKIARYAERNQGAMKKTRVSCFSGFSEGDNDAPPRSDQDLNGCQSCSSCPFRLLIRLVISHRSGLSAWPKILRRILRWAANLKMPKPPRCAARFADVRGCLSADQEPH